MAFDWREFLELARTLQGSSGNAFSTEAANRSAVSRAYYAAFCYIRNYARNTLGFKQTGSMNDHKRLQEHLRNCGDPWRKIADDLRDLRLMRNRCDYDDTVPQLVNVVKTAINIAQSILHQSGQGP